MVAFFKKPYTVKRFEGNIIINGYPSSGYAEVANVYLDVQEESASSAMDENGKRATKHIRAFGQFPFRCAESPDIKGDLLRYNEQWYECVSCVQRCNTLLRHYDASFTLLPDGSSNI